MQALGWLVMAAAQFNGRRRRLTRYEDPASAEDDYYRFANRNE